MSSPQTAVLDYLGVNLLSLHIAVFSHVPIVLAHSHIEDFGVQNALNGNVLTIFENSRNFFSQIFAFWRF